MILCKWPSRERAALFKRQFPLWDKPGVRFVISVDEDDAQVGEYVEYLAGRPNVRTCVGRSSGKIDAYNRDLSGESFETLVVASDDFTPQREDWANEIRRLMTEHFPDGDGMLHVNDGRNGRALCTMPIMGYAYYKRFNYVYHGSYRALWCDNEAQAVAERMGKVAYVPEVIFLHEWTKVTGRDPLHLRNEREWDHDQANFERRQAWGFPS